MYYYLVRWDLPKRPNRKLSATTPVLWLRWSQASTTSYLTGISHHQTQFTSILMEEV